jgi:hypothetical protein
VVARVRPSTAEDAVAVVRSKYPRRRAGVWRADWVPPGLGVAGFWVVTHGRYKKPHAGEWVVVEPVGIGPIYVGRF